MSAEDPERSQGAAGPSWENRAVTAVGIGMWAFVGLSSIHRELNGDEIEHVHAAWKVWQGERPYTDFFEHHHPLGYYLTAPLIGLLGETTTTILALRVVVFVLATSILYATYRLARRAFGRDTARLAVVLLAATSVFTVKVIEIRPDVPMTLFGLISLGLLFRYFDDRRDVFLWAAGGAVGASFLFLQKAIFLGAAVGVLAAEEGLRSGKWVRIGFHLGIGFLAAVGPYFGYLALTGQMGTYLETNWWLNLHWLERLSPRAVLLSTLTENTLLWFFLPIGSALSLGLGHGRRLTFVAAILFASVLVVPQPYRQYFMPLMPIVCILSAYGMGTVMSGRRGLLLFAVVFAAARPLAYLVSIHAFSGGLKTDFERINFVLGITGKDERVYDGCPAFNVYRPDLDYFWFSTAPSGGGRGLDTLRLKRPHPYDVLDLIERLGPKVISECFIPDLGDGRIVERYVPAEGIKGIRIRRGLEE